MRKAFADTTYEIMKNDHSVVTLLGDIGVFGFKKCFDAFPNRTINLGILEQTMIGVGAGMAQVGLNPIIHSIAPFLTERALEQIKLDFGYQMLRGNIVTVGASYDYSALGCTHHCPGDVQTVLGVPHAEVYVPGTAQEFIYLFGKAYDNSKLSYFRLSENENKETLEIEVGEPFLIKSGSNATVICVGPTLDLTLKVFEKLNVTIIYLNSLRPLNTKKIEQLSISNNYLFIEPFFESTTIQEIFRNGNLLNGKYRFVGVPHDFIRKYGTKSELDIFTGFTAKNIFEKYKDLVNG